MGFVPPSRDEFEIRDIAVAVGFCLLMSFGTTLYPAELKRRGDETRQRIGGRDRGTSGPPARNKVLAEIKLIKELTK